MPVSVQEPLMPSSLIYLPIQMNPEKITTAPETLTPGHEARLGQHQLLAISSVVS